VLGTFGQLFKGKCRDPIFGKYFSVKEGFLGLLVEYILVGYTIYNKIE